MNRRNFLKTGAAFGLIAVMPAMAKAKVGNQVPTSTLKGPVFDLNIKYTRVNMTGKTVIATTVNDMLPAPTLRWRKGEIVTIRVTNHLDEPTSLHWHGIVLPFKMDGVPGVSFRGINPGETFVYRFKVNQTGSYWYHSHSGFQEQSGLHGAIVIDDGIRVNRDYVVALQDWSDESPDTIYRHIKVQSDYYNFHKRTLPDFIKEIKSHGLSDAFARRSMWNKMRMDSRDISDVTGATYTYCINDLQKHFYAKAGEKVRLRFINQSAMTHFDFRIPGHKMKVIAVDGYKIKPVWVDDIRIAVAESYDVIVKPKGNTLIYVEDMGRSGKVYAKLGPNASANVSLPEPYPFEELTMVDMGMKMDNMNMGGMKMGAKTTNSNSMNGMKMGDTKKGGMQMSNNSMSSSKMSGMKMQDSKMNMQKSKHSNMNMKVPITPLPMKKGIAWTMEAKGAQYRLDDPGIGLRSVKRKVLTYADLHTPHIHNRKPDREIVMHLTGNMERYIWAINGIPYYESEPLEFKYGERLRVTFINDTMMNHPMHLHGMWSDVEVGNKILRKHTVNIQPGSKVSLRINVDAKGKWVYHCHLFYHMGGMFREVKVKS